jgi:hypothetical protein
LQKNKTSNKKNEKNKTARQKKQNKKIIFGSGKKNKLNKKKDKF